MNKLRNKIKNKKGFTLVEMLIVVAIIAILVVVSIPIINSSLEKAKVAADDANVRAAKAAANVKYLEGEYNDGTVVGTGYVYDAASGTLKDTSEKSSVEGYGQSSATDDGVNFSGATDLEKIPNGKIIQIAIDSEGSVTYKWVEGKTD